MGSEMCIRDSLGTLTRKVAEFTFEVDFGTYCRKYNQRHMKPAVSESDQNLDMAIEAYDSVINSSPTDQLRTTTNTNHVTRGRTRRQVERFGVVMY